MKSRFVVLLILAAFSLASCMKKEGTATDAGANAKADSMKAAYKAISAAWDAGKVDEFDKYVSADTKDNNMMPGQKPGLAGMKEFASMLKVAYPDMSTTVEDMRVDGDVLTARFRMNGTNSGPFMGMPATNKKLTNVMGIDQVRWSNGKFVEHWGLFDDHTMMMQLGLAPMPGEGGMKPPAEGGKMEKPMGKKK
ncbi:MAG: ester cyclase [Bacteroidota bacterium]|nr:ester cyclase [Bacteroidota bacterium]MDP4229848.1 ester cyclase [Bacteroidota bacterium]MDP4234977.1 ester cyclase [Bacteroidota bacterium]